YLGIGAATSGDYRFIVVLLTSSLLNAVYFLPLVHAAWFKEPSDELRQAFARRTSSRWEISPLLLVPTITTALMALAAGLFAASPFSPLGLAKMITTGFYLP